MQDVSKRCAILESMGFAVSRWRGRTKSNLALLLAITALLSLVHTLNHDAIAGPDHHEEGDAAGSMVELALVVLGSVLLAAAAVGFAGRPASWAVAILQPRRKPHREVIPKSRAGPVVLGVLRT